MIVGGGTGGHVIPGLAIARELCEHYSADVLFVGTARGMETRLVPKAGFPLELIRVGQLKNVSAITRIKTLTDLPRSIVQAAQLLRRWKPDAAISVGGYASGPGALAALALRVPLVAFEPNYVAGFANRRIARFVAAAGVQFEQTARAFRNGEVTGVPIRREFFEVPPLADSPAANLLIFGGSQGARAINQAVVAALPQLAAQLPQLRIVHQTGPKDLESTRAAYNNLPAGTRLASCEVLEFIDDMPCRFADATVVLCRSGASTVAEIAAAGRVGVFVPLPTAADDHQTKNAEAFVQKRAGELLPQSQLSAESLTQTLIRLFSLEHRAYLAETGQNARGLARPDAAQRIAEMAAKAALRSRA